MSKIPFRIGPFARQRLKKTSPFATLLLEISSSMTIEDVSQFKLAIQVDKLGTKRQLFQLKNAADILSHLENKEHIAPNSTDFLEQLLIKIGRKDLELKIEKYHRKRLEQQNATATSSKDSRDQTQVKYTQLKSLVGESRTTVLGSELGALSIKSDNTAVKEVFIRSTQRRSSPDGRTNLPHAPAQENLPLPTKTSFDSSDSHSPMSIDNSQTDKKVECITDEEKLEFLNDKVWVFETDDATMASQ